MVIIEENEKKAKEKTKSKTKNKQKQKTNKLRKINPKLKKNFFILNSKP